jgi:CubicO group peptidase (beta-lactamase class C family)
MVEMKVGLGWIIKERPGEEWIWHNGGTGGYTDSMQIDIENRNAVIILSNVSGISGKRVNIDSLCDRLMGTMKDD